MKTLFTLACFFSLAAISCKTASRCRGPVVADCACTMQYDPVCGCDGKTYGNACTATCAGIKKWKKGACP